LKLSTIINYCSNDFRFIDHVIRSVLPFTDQVIVPICDHFYDGEPENKQKLLTTYLKNPAVRFVEFSYDSEKAWLGARYWTNMARTRLPLCKNTARNGVHQ